uniref:Uncharacterized protein n=1 Tax=Timema douglasi TaxID=61478 RepID=A0A7R8VAL5_TIMDO|nr:unnamed protein product [Timema douglasi]
MTSEVSLHSTRGASFKEITRYSPASRARCYLRTLLEPLRLASDPGVSQSWHLTHRPKARLDPLTRGSRDNTYKVLPPRIALVRELLNTSTMRVESGGI